MRWWLVFLSLSFTRSLRAESTTVLPIELSWDAPSGCGSAELVLAQVQSMLGAATVDPNRRVRANVTVRRNDAEGLELELDTFEGEVRGERRLNVNSCDDATHAAALLLTLQLDPNRGASAPEPPPSDASAKIQPPAPAPVPTPTELPPPPSDVARRRLRPELGVSAATDLGSLPHVGLGAALDASLRYESLRLLLRGSWWAPQRAESGELAGAGADFQLYDASLLACLSPLGDAQLTPEICAGGSALYLRAKGYGVSEPEVASALGWGALGELGLRLELGTAWSLQARGGALALTPRHEFAIRNLDVLHRPATVSGRLLIGATCTF